MCEKELVVGMSSPVAPSIRFSSKVVSIDESGYFKLVHLADRTILKAKVLVGRHGLNSVVAKWLGFKQPAFTGRSAIRGRADLTCRRLLLRAADVTPISSST